MKRIKNLAVVTAIGIITSQAVMAKDIIHDGEYNFIKPQYEEAWAIEDQQIEQKLAEL